MKPKTIDSRELIKILQHWKVARHTRLNEVEKAENLRCVVDVVALLKENGVIPPDDIWDNK